MSYTSSLSNPVQWLVDWFRGGDAASGVKVTLDTVLGDPSVYSAVRKIAEHIALMPLELKAIKGRESNAAVNDPLYDIVCKSPNEMQTAFMFRSTLMLHAMLAGNGRAAIVRDAMGMPVELIPLLPSQTITCLEEGKKWHAVTPQHEDQITNYVDHFNDRNKNSIVAIPDKDVLHFMGLSYSGFVGMSVVDVLKDAFGLGIGAQKAVSSSFRSPKPGVLIHAPQGMFRDDSQAKQFMADFNEFHTGVDNTNKAALLRDGMTTSVLPINASDAQWIEQRRFHRQDVASIFGLESFIGDGEPSPYKSVSERNTAYMTNCLLPWMVKIEQEWSKKLIMPIRRKRMFFEFNQQSLLRMDFPTSITSLSGAITSRIMSPNEARERLRMNPYDGGDEFFNPAITPGGSEEESEPQDETDDESEPKATAIEDRSRGTIRAYVSHLIGIERQRVEAAAGKEKNFLDWLDRWYGDWQNTIAKALAKLGVEEAIAADHCKQSRRALLDLAGEITDVEAWPAAVADLVGGWDSRADEMVDQITGVANVDA
ncbi:phage portal protein [Stieleria sp.]|uniref:phage portal protein n=1 Tax=Stieleria sp. TaxID=2795976 RepID=UPI00356A9E2F